MKENLITVQGAGSLRIEPDLAVVECMVEETCPSYAAANLELNQRVKFLRQALTQLGGPADDLKTTDFGVSRTTRRNSETDDYEFFGYRAHHTLELRLPLDKERLNRTVEGLLASKARASVEVRFTVSDPQPLRDRLLSAAVANARQRAETIVKAAGAGLGKIHNISYGVTEVRFRSDVLFSTDDVCGSESPDITPGSFAVQDSVAVTWELVQ